MSPERTGFFGFFKSKIGGPSELSPVLIVPPLELLDYVGFVHTPRYKDKAFLHQKYVVEGLSIAQIAAQISSSKEAVRCGLVAAGIPIREAHKPHGRPAQPRFGKRVVAGKTQAHIAETRVVKAVVDMRAQGMTLRQIAAFLSQIGVPTKCRGKGWHPQMVSRILKGPEAEPVVTSLQRL